MSSSPVNREPKSMAPTTGFDLRRSLGYIRATAMVVGTIIGASIFVQPSEITGTVASVSGVFLVWTVAGLLTLLGALVTAELASAFPRAGGVYVFLNEAFTPAVGFLWGWAMFWIMHSGIIAAIAVVFGRYTAFFLPIGDAGIRVVAITGIVLLSAVNYLGVQHGSTVQTAFTIGKVAAILGMIAVGFTFGTAVPPDAAASAMTVQETVSPRGFALALIAGLFAFGGWHMITYAAEETIEPRRTIPMALLIGVAVVTVCYMLLNGVYLYVLPMQAVIDSSRVAADAADAVLGSGGAAFMAGLVVFSTFGALSGIILAGPRVYYSMARDGLLFRALGRVHPTFRTPHRAIVLQAMWASVLVATGTYRALFTRVIYTEWIFFGLMAIGLIMLRHRPAYLPAYRVWGGPFVPMIFVLSSALIVLNQILSDLRESAVGLSLVLIGLPIYLVSIGRRRRASGGIRESH